MELTKKQELCLYLITASFVLDVVIDLVSTIGFIADLGATP